MVVDGVEIMRLVRDGEFKDGDKIEENRRMFRYNAEIESFYEVDGDEKPMMDYYTDKEFASTKFEILSEEDKEIDIQSIVEFILPTTYLDEEAETMYVRSKINELIKAVKQLDKNKEDK